MSPSNMNDGEFSDLPSGDITDRLTVHMILILIHVDKITFSTHQSYRLIQRLDMSHDHNEFTAANRETWE